MDHPVHDLFHGLPRQRGKRRSCGTGAHGPRVFDWARVEVRPWHREDRQHWVIARRSVSRPDEVSYCIAYCPAGTTLDQLHRRRQVGGRRVLPDRQRPVRPGGLPGPLLPRLAPPHHPCHGSPRCPDRPAGSGTRHRESRNGSPGLIPLSLPELRRLIHRITNRRPASVDHVLRWSHWRRCGGVGDPGRCRAQKPDFADSCPYATTDGTDGLRVVLQKRRRRHLQGGDESWQGAQRMGNEAGGITTAHRDSPSPGHPLRGYRPRGRHQRVVVTYWSDDNSNTRTRRP